MVKPSEPTTRGDVLWYGLGPLATRVQRVAIGMDGLAWHRAATAMGQARRTRSVFILSGPDASRDQDITSMIDFLFSLRMRWTESQREAIRLLQNSGIQRDVAEHLGIRPASVSNRLSGAMWRQDQALRVTAQRQLNQYASELE